MAWDPLSTYRASGAPSGFAYTLSYLPAYTVLLHLTLKGLLWKFTERKFVLFSINMTGVFWDSKKCLLLLIYCPFLPCQEFLFPGERQLGTTELSWLPGFCHSRKDKKGITDLGTTVTGNENKEFINNFTIILIAHIHYALFMYQVMQLLYLFWCVGSTASRQRC